MPWMPFHAPCPPTHGLHDPRVKWSLGWPGGGWGWLWEWLKVPKQMQIRSIILNCSSIKPHCWCTFVTETERTFSLHPLPSASKLPISVSSARDKAWLIPYTKPCVKWSESQMSCLASTNPPLWGPMQSHSRVGLSPSTVWMSKPPVTMWNISAQTKGADLRQKKCQRRPKIPFLNSSWSATSFR